MHAPSFLAVTLAILIELDLRASSVQADEPFRTLAFEAACSAAKSEGKVVMIDFFTTWCGPCKKLDAVTWKDEGVVKWLAEKTVPLRIDAEKEEVLAERFRIDAYPSLVFVQPDGKELGRLVGFKEPQAFLSAANDLLAGVHASDRIKKQLEEKGWNDPMLRQDYADELVRERRYEEALEHYLWCFDQGLEHRPSYAGVRLSFLLSDIVQLGKKHPQALAELRKRRDAGKESLLDGTASFEQAAEFSAIDRVLGEDRLTLEVYDKLASVEPRTVDGRRTNPRATLFREIKKLLLADRRYADFLAGAGEPEGYYNSLLEFYRMAYGSRTKDDPDLTSFGRRNHVEEASGLYEALLGAHRDDAATRIQEHVLEFDASRGTYDVLAKSARRAGRAEIAEKLEQAAAEEKDEK